MITAYLDATRTQEDVAQVEGQGYSQQGFAKIVKEVLLLFADIAKSSAPYKIPCKEDGKEIQKQLGYKFFQR